MRKFKNIYIIYLIIVLGIAVFSFYIYIGFQFGKGVSNMSKKIHEVKINWQNNKENPLDSIEKSVIKTIDSIDKKQNNNKLVH